MSEPIDFTDVWDDEVDAIVEEIWEVRRKIWERFDNDPARINAHMMEQHAKRVRQGHREITLPPEEAARISAACEAMLRQLRARSDEPGASAQR